MFARIKYSYLKSILMSLTFIFVGTLFLSLFHMSTDMSMTNHILDCPMMMEGGVICQMDFNEHMSFWSALSLAIPVLLLTLLLLLPYAKAFSMACSVLFGQSISVWKLSTVSFYQKQSPTYTVRPLQELFSSGILHPKIYHPVLS